MTGTPNLEFRPLVDDEIELAIALAASQAGMEDGAVEGWGIAPSGAAPLVGEAWGLFFQGTLGGAAWIVKSPAGVGEITALVLARKRWGMGLVTWVLDQIATAVQEVRELVVILPGGYPGLGESLEDAGFRGPGLEEDTYPRGTWRRILQGAP